MQIRKEYKGVDGNGVLHGEKKSIFHCAAIFCKKMIKKIPVIGIKYPFNYPVIQKYTSNFTELLGGSILKMCNQFSLFFSIQLEFICSLMIALKSNFPPVTSKLRTHCTYYGLPYKQPQFDKQ